MEEITSNSFSLINNNESLLDEVTFIYKRNYFGIINGLAIYDYKNTIFLLDELEELYLKNHNFTNIPEEIFKLNNLKVLDLSRNKIETIPNSIRCLESLEKFNLSGNKNIKIPDSMKNLNKFQKS